MRHYDTRYQAEKARKKGEEKVVKVSGGYMVMDYSEYRVWKKQIHDERPRPDGEGWHQVGPYMVYVENHLVVRGMKKDQNNQWVPAYSYRTMKDFPGSRQYHWSRENMTLAALRAGLSRGTCTMA